MRRLLCIRLTRVNLLVLSHFFQLQSVSSKMEIPSVFSGTDPSVKIQPRLHSFTALPFDRFSRNTFGDTRVSASLTLDGHVQTGWSITGAQGPRRTAVFLHTEPLPAGKSLTIHLPIRPTL